MKIDRNHPRIVYTNGIQNGICVGICVRRSGSNLTDEDNLNISGSGGSSSVGVSKQEIYNAPKANVYVENREEADEDSFEDAYLRP